MSFLSLQFEGEKIFRQLFRVPPPQRLLERYQQGCETLFASFSEMDQKECSFAVEKIDDLEALELAARLQNRLPLLSAKFRLIVALAECEPALRSYFVTQKDQSLKPWLEIFFVTCRSVVKFLKGRLYLKCHFNRVRQLQ